MQFAGELTAEMRDVAFKFNSVMTGVSEAPERWQTCTAKATGTDGFNEVLTRLNIALIISLIKIYQKYATNKNKLSCDTWDTANICKIG